MSGHGCGDPRECPSCQLADLRSKLRASEAECERLRREVKDVRLVTLLQAIDWLYERRHKSAAVDLDCNWNDGPPGDGSCQKLRDRRAAVEYLEKKEKADE